MVDKVVRVAAVLAQHIRIRLNQQTDIQELQIPAVVAVAVLLVTTAVPTTITKELMVVLVDLVS